KEIPWGHNILIINKIKDKKVRKYYLKTSSEFAWSRTVLLNQIKADAMVIIYKSLSNIILIRP
ncbi:MAG: DUF1016 N-terminal domain-containing protein, partial [Bacteroidota bacterium]